MLTPLQGQLNPLAATSKAYGQAYYVSTTGNDTTGTGTLAAPWKTIDKAINTVPNLRCQILLEDGTYQETTGALNDLFINRAFSNTVTIQPRLGALGSVTIQNKTTPTNFCIRFSGAKNITFRYCTITPQGRIGNPVIAFIDSTTTSDIAFEHCTITVNTQSGLNLAGAGCNFTATGNLQRVRFSGCTINYINAFPTYGFQFIRNSSGSVIDGVTVDNCNVSSQSSTLIGSYFTGVSNLILTNSTVAAQGVGVQMGGDGAAAFTTTGYIQNCTITSSASHGLLVGQNTVGVNVSDCTVNAGDIGIVLKGDTTIIERVIQNYGTDDGLLFKGCSNPIVRNCTLRANVVNKAAVNFALQGSTKVSNVTLTNNTIIATGAAKCMIWPDSSIDAGGGVCDTNTYDKSATSGNVGNVRATSNITTLAALQAAWSGYGVNGNDVHSTVI